MSTPVDTTQVSTGISGLDELLIGGFTPTAHYIGNADPRLNAR
jgi:hypothetical protein